MALHSAGLMALMMDATQGAPAIVPCIPTVPDPLWKSLLQIAQIIIPVAGGVLIAWMAFRWNSSKEHERWILDQKKSEWKELLQSASSIESVIPAISRIQERYDSVSRCLPQKIAQLLGVRAGCIFVGDVLRRQESVDAFAEFAEASAAAAECLQGFNAQTETDPAVRQLCGTKYEEIRGAYLKFCNWLRTEAGEDLDAR
jgi:hypothetical protein